VTARWNPRKTITETEKPVRVVVPSGASTGDSHVEPRGATWGIRERGDTGGTVVHAYRCPVHGIVDVRVLRADVPDEVPCPLMIVPDVVEYGGGRESRLFGGEPPDRTLSYDEAAARYGRTCGQPSPWAGSSCGIGISSGEVTC
jgi:hypothetical protein